MSAILQQKLSYNYIIKNLNPKELSNVPLSLFEDTDINNIFKLVTEFANKFNNIPNKQQLKVLLQNNNSSISSSFVDTLYDEDLNNYEQDWLKSSIEGSIAWKKFYEKLINTITYIKSIGTVEPQKSQEYIDKCSMLLNTGDLHIFDNNKDIGISFNDIDRHFKTTDDFITTTHNWIDQRLGGYTTGTLQVYCGFANVGKSIFLCNDAASYVKLGYDVLYISAEMNESSVMQRIDANILDIPIDWFRDKSKEDKIRKSMKNFVDSSLLPIGNLYVKQFPTSLATVADIERYYLQMVEKGLAPKVIVIDYINILAASSKNIADNTYLKIKSIAEELRAFAIKYKLIIITATQLNRSGDEVSDITLSSIAESAGLVHTADTMYGIIQTSDMKLVNEYWLKILRIREGGGKNNRCLYNIDYSRMRLTETNDIMESAD